MDLSTLESEKTHEVWLDVEDGNGKLFLLITISGKTYGRQIDEEQETKIDIHLKNRFSW